MRTAIVLAVLIVAMAFAQTQGGEGYGDWVYNLFVQWKPQIKMLWQGLLLGATLGYIAVAALKTFFHAHVSSILQNGFFLVMAIFWIITTVVQGILVNAPMDLGKWGKYATEVITFPGQ